MDTIRWMPFRNDSSETVPANAVMRITDSIKGTSGREILTCDKPNSDFERIYAVNGSAQVYAGQYGSCCYAFDGPVMVAYEGGTPAFGEGWGAKPGSWLLNKNYPVGFTIQGRNNTDKERTLCVQQPINSFMGKLNGSLSPAGSAAVSVYAGALSTDITDWNVTVYDVIMKTGATAIAVDKRVICKWINGFWIFVQAECA